MLGQEAALKSASNYRYLRKMGVTIRKTIDIIIGTFCIHSAFSLLHDDSDFTPLEKYLHLKVVQN
jgi:predicted nucleic acid-binding protein